jgi:thioredoxin reductase
LRIWLSFASSSLSTFSVSGSARALEQAKEAGVAVDKDNYIVIDWLQHTNLEGVYAAGDVTNHPVKQIGTAVGMGITAAVEAYAYIRRPYHRIQ